MKIAWSVGHSPNKMGAYSKYLGEWEYNLAKEVVEEGVRILKLYSYLQVLVPKSFRLMDKVFEINNWNADIAIESHFNSSLLESANGCETIYYSGVGKYSEKGRILANLIQNNILKSAVTIDQSNPFKLKDRGIKGMGDITRIYNGKETIPRFTFLMKTKMPAVISEPLFLSNRSDCSLILGDRKLAIRKIAEGVADGILEYIL